jgi:hypothetical protein
MTHYPKGLRKKTIQELKGDCWTDISYNPRLVPSRLVSSAIDKMLNQRPEQKTGLYEILLYASLRCTNGGWQEDDYKDTRLGIALDS